MKKYSLLLAIAVLSFVACDNDDDDDTTPSSSTEAAMGIHFHPKVGMEDLVIGNDYTVNGETISWSMSQFYVSKIKLWKDALGNEKLSIPNSYYLVKPNHATAGLGNVPVGKYYGIEFYFGVADSAVNHADPSLALGDLAPQNPGMHWSWNTGYIFLRAEGEIKSGVNTGTNFEYHVGLDKMARMVTVAKEFNVAANVQNEVMIMVDHAAMLNGLDFATDTETHTGDNMPLALKIADNMPNNVFK